MFYKITSTGYFGGVAKVSRHPMYKDHMVEDDGLDWFYTFTNMDGEKCYLLSNNLAIEDRERMASLYHSMQRNNKIAWFAVIFLSVETMMHVQYLKKMPMGWRVPSLFGVAFLYKSLFMMGTGYKY